MNYLRHYCKLIRKAENRTLPEGYTEKHHTFPKSIFGKNNRIVVLTAREHYIAHVLLEKICIQRYGLVNDKTIKMNFAHLSMKGNNRTYFNSKLYESARKRRSDNMKGKKFNLGRKHSDELRKMQSELRKGMKWWNNGKIHVRSKECPGEGWKNGRTHIKGGKPCTEEVKMKISQKNKGRKMTEEQKKKISKIRKGKKRPELSKKMQGNFNYFLKRGNLYEIISPHGNIGYTCRLKQFCKKNNLDRSAIGHVINYKHKHHKGWIVSRIND
jgi:hypothetical protein